MPNTNRSTDPLPDEFSSDQEAADFWERHSLSEYEEFLEPADLDVAIQRRHFEIEVDQECFQALRETARKEQKPIKQLASEILKQKLRAG